MKKNEATVWLSVSATVVLVCIFFTWFLFPSPAPLDEQLSDFEVIADSDDLWQRGVIQHGEGHFDEAMTLYTQAIEIHPESKMAFLYRGTLYYDQANYNAAILDYTQALEIDSVFTWALNARGVAYYRKGNMDEAQQDFTRSQELDPNFIGPIVNQAVIEKLDGNLDEALMILAQAEGFSLASTPSLDVLENIADIQFNQGKKVNALATISKLVEFYPDYAKAYAARAKIYHALGDTEKANADESTYKQLSSTEGTK